VSLVPAGAEALVAAGHSVQIEHGRRRGSGFPDELYTDVGATDRAGRGDACGRRPT
jgi:alanine dehydrogenase